MIFNVNNNTVSLDVTAAPLVAVALPSEPVNSLGRVKQFTLRVVNIGSNTAYIAVGDSAVLATVPTSTQANTCTPVLPGGDSVFSIAVAYDTHISAVCGGADTTTLVVTLGEGA